MTGQQNFSVRFRIAYSYHLERLIAIFNRRLDKLLLFIQFVLGSAVITEHGPALLLGVLVAVMAGLQFVLKPGEIAGAAKAQAQKYSELLDEFDVININDIKQKITRIEKDDSPVIGSLKEVARNAAARMLGAETDGAPGVPGRVIAWFCGERAI